jgi:hypothetical protein
MNKSVVCTFFEGNYHYGVAALANSLYKNGFRGNIYAGFRGELPKWANNAIKNDELSWENAKTLRVIEGLQLHFLPLTTNYHLTNYKPDFMLELLAGPAKFTDTIIYADPDIIVNAPWHFLQSWVESGVALCEDVNSPLPMNHPRRIAWRNTFNEYNIKLSFKEQQYVNGGFIGLHIKDIMFLKKWQQVQEVMADVIGGLDKSSLKGNALNDRDSGPFSPFSKTDQDALNCAVEAYDFNCSIIGKEAMGFISGVSYLPHALGTPKPWDWPFLIQSIQGIPPTQSVKAYWQNTKGIIECYSVFHLLLKRTAILISSFIGRFYKKN